MNELEDRLRKFSLDKLEALAAIASNAQGVATTTTVSGVLTKTGKPLGGLLSSLARTKINEQPLIITAGRSPEEGFLWKVNEKAAPKDVIENFVNQILEENKKYRTEIK